MARDFLGRASESALIDGFLGGLGVDSISMLIEGEPGIGKTTLWQRAIEMGRSRSIRVLSCQAVETETKLAYVALDDLVRPILGEGIGDLPKAQRRALEVAFLQEDAAGPPLEARAVMLGALGIIRTASRTGPVLIAVDDVQWLDASSARALSFISRRLADAPIGLLGTMRLTQTTLAVESARHEGVLDVQWDVRLLLEGLDEPAFMNLIHDRLETHLSGGALRQVYLTSSGNPLFGLELSRSLARSADHYTGRMLTVPKSVQDMLADRVANLTASTREVLRYAAALSRPTIELVAAAADSTRQMTDALDEAVTAGVLVGIEPRIRFAHPLLGSIVYWQASPRQRRVLHRRLAVVVGGQEERARHLAAATVGVNSRVADVLVNAAAVARARGAPDAGGQLLEEAIRLTPARLAAKRMTRCLEAGWCHFQAADPDRAKALIQEVVDVSPSGPLRAEALRRLGRVHYHFESWKVARECLEWALTEVGSDPRVRGPIEFEYAMALSFHGDIEGALRHAESALRQANAVSSKETLPECLALVGLMRYIVTGRFDRATTDRAVSLQVWGPDSAPGDPGLARAMILKFVDDFEQASAQIDSDYRRLRDSGHETSLPMLLVHWVQLDSWAGRLREAEAHAAEALEITRRSKMEPLRALALGTAALAAAYRGDESLARTYGSEGIALGEQTENMVAIALSLTALGALAVAQGDWSAAHACLAPLAQQDEGVGLANPTILRFHADEIEALAQLGQLAAADRRLRQLETQALELEGIWSIAVSTRCRAIVEAAGGNLEAASEAISRAIELHKHPTLPLEWGRCHLVKGMIERRVGRKQAARESYDAAQAIFERIGAFLWAQRARTELDKLGTRTFGLARLTDAEQRVAELAAAGQSNKEIAAALFVSVRAVEQHLSSVYRKLSFRSRTELAISFRDSSGHHEGAEQEPK